jgi:hypothetical protein
MEIKRRGTYGFEVTEGGHLRDCPENVELLRSLWSSRDQISGDLLGPGDPGDFDHGAWHVSCHLVAAGGVLRLADGSIAWVEIAHNSKDDLYYPAVTLTPNRASSTLTYDLRRVEHLLAVSQVLGFIEGTSQGRISARNAHDPPERFNRNPRQEYDQPVNSSKEGGKVWEHWCTLRDVRGSSVIATSVLQAYVTLCSHLGDPFPAFVARGRGGYGHPEQLAAMTIAGFISSEAATQVISPIPIPAPSEWLFKEGEAETALEAVRQLAWPQAPSYYMFSRRIGEWNVEPRSICGA